VAVTQQSRVPRSHTGAGCDALDGSPEIREWVLRCTRTADHYTPADYDGMLSRLRDATLFDFSSAEDVILFMHLTCRYIVFIKIA